jgi:hypothetical protein
MIPIIYTFFPSDENIQNENNVIWKERFDNRNWQSLILVLYSQMNNEMKVLIKRNSDIYSSYL